jgi:hypothetical protein
MLTKKFTMESSVKLIDFSFLDDRLSIEIKTKVPLS